MSNKLFQIELIQPAFDGLYEKYEFLHSRAEESFLKDEFRPKTLADYIAEAVNYFKDEYNKVRFSGLTYEYDLGLNFKLSDCEPKEGELNTSRYKTSAIEQLCKAGFVISYEIENRVEDDYGLIVRDFAICLIDETRLTQQDSPIATEVNAQSIIKKVVHEHTHRFENSIQQSPVNMNVTVSNQANRKVLSQKFPHTIPAGTKWEHITISFVDDNNVEVGVAGYVEKQGYVNMGMSDSRSGSPNEQWKLLKVLAKCAGTITAGMPEARDEYKKQKQLLSDTLKYYFTNDVTPFHTYSKKQGYKTKFTIFVKKDAPFVTYPAEPNPMDGYDEMLVNH